MSGFSHIAPFRHYHRIEDGTTYFAINGVIHSAPTEKDTIDGCKFDLDASLTIQDWESPSEFEPFRHEVEAALGLTLTLNHRERVRDAINAMNCEWHADYDYPDFLAVYPEGAARSPAANDDGIPWSFGIANGPWGGNDQEGNEGVQWDDLPADSDPDEVAKVIVTFMRKQLLKRVGWLNDFIEKCVTHIEKTSATSPETTGGPWAIVKGMPAYEEAQKLISTWRRS